MSVRDQRSCEVADERQARSLGKDGHEPQRSQYFSGKDPVTRMVLNTFVIGEAVIVRGYNGDKGYVGWKVNANVKRGSVRS